MLFGKSVWRRIRGERIVHGESEGGLINILVELVELGGVYWLAPNHLFCGHEWLGDRCVICCVADKTIHTIDTSSRALHHVRDQIHGLLEVAGPAKPARVSDVNVVVHI